MNRKLLFGLALLAVVSIVGLILAPRLAHRMPGSSVQPAFGDILAVGTETALHRAFVRSVSGLVESAPPPGDSDFRELQPGVFLDRHTVVRSAPDSSAVLQFGSAATVMVEPGSLVELRGEVFRNGEVLVTLRVHAGEVLARAPQLGPQERFRIVTGQAVTTIEGGSLIVRTVSNGTGEATQVAVESGSASILPMGVDTERLAWLLGDRESSRVAQEFAEKATRVESGTGLTITGAELRGASQVLYDIERDIEQAVGTGRSFSAAELRRMSAVMEYVSEGIDDFRPEYESMSDADRRALGLLSEPSVRAFEVSADTSRAPATVRIETDPPDAEIYLEGLPIGKRIYSALFLDDERPEFEVRRRGYHPRHLQIDFLEDRDQVVRVRLERMSPAMSSSEFLEAAAQGANQEVLSFIETGGDVNYVDDLGLNALARALGLPAFARGRVDAFRPDRRSVELLLEAGIETRLPFNVDGRRLFALHLPVLASLAGVEVDLDLVELLIRADSPVDGYLETSEMSVTPLGAAVIVGLESGSVNYELIELLLRHGANPNAGLVYEGRVMDVISAAVVFGYYTGHTEAGLVRLLLQYGAEQNLRFRLEGAVGTPLQFAERLGLDEIAAVLRSELAVR